MAGRTRIVNNLPQFVGQVEVKAANAMTRALILGASEASVMTPIATSNLLNSQFRQVEKDGTRIVGTVGYTAEYALPVHDPDNPQTFRRASATKEFLTKGFEQAKPAIDAEFERALKT